MWVAVNEEIAYEIPDRERSFTVIEEQAHDYARRLGALIRARREAVGLRMEDLAGAAGVGVRFIHDLETGKPSCQLGRSLAVAASLGLDLIDLLEEDEARRRDPAPEQ
ncbi:anaerobic benzoate catabolism transcriptional regulator [Brevundimonas diminuta]|jgi:y4mF family transcriptional regulator|uniref:Transcriptional regulator n=2 Tax=Caulobacteraceae TaxID=76892 RepID=A0A246K744_BREDI|nr:MULTISPECIES: helix-turn-helix domain-containing protein [Brevundimonas]EGF94752.1 helix-turn-helix family protein [Brevundimonas diminuta ATCC 11568]EKY24379.1 transcriptional regulator, y4mF family [Brevundimonas diminuta 470-4]OJU52325.1 MAG: transcriptional regulator [Brevundimonas sp. 67-6]OMG60714.1 transcriptional regulator [Brevundimonas sp. ZS04]MBD3572704.1 transcriptional regulator [Brevundimonas diminuta]